MFVFGALNISRFEEGVSRSIVVFKLGLVSLLEGLICTVFTLAQSPEEWKGEKEEDDPESNDLAEEPGRAVRLGIGTLLAILAEVSDVNECVGHQAEESVGDRDVPEHEPFHTDADHCQQHRRADPLNHVEDCQQKEG